MRKFNIRRSELIRVWVDTIYSVEADSLEEAVKCVNTGNEIAESSEVNYGTETVLNPEDNNGNPTIEIYDNRRNLIYNNGEIEFYDKNKLSKEDISHLISLWEYENGENFFKYSGISLSNKSKIEEFIVNNYKHVHEYCLETAHIYFGLSAETEFSDIIHDVQSLEEIVEKYYNRENYEDLYGSYDFSYKAYNFIGDVILNIDEAWDQFKKFFTKSTENNPIPEIYKEGLKSKFNFYLKNKYE